MEEKQENNQEQKAKKNESAKKGRPPQSEKKKVISKQKKVRKKKNKQRNNQISSEELSQENDSQVKIEQQAMPTSKVQFFQHLIGFYMEFFERIDLRKGFIFNKQQRKNLRKQQLGIQWTVQCYWNCQDERAKILKILQDQEIVNKDQIQILSQMANFVGSIFGSQSTEQLYTILIKIYKICKNSIKLQQQQRFGEINKEARLLSLEKNILQNNQDKYKFFSFNFSKIYLVSNAILRQQTHLLIRKIYESFSNLYKMFLKDKLKNEKV